MAASATFALKAGVWFRRARLLIVSPDSRVNLARRQAETPLIPVFRFLRPALVEASFQRRMMQDYGAQGINTGFWIGNRERRSCRHTSFCMRGCATQSELA